MAATEILAVGITQANSSDQVVAAGAELAICIKDAAGPRVGSGAIVEIQLKDDAGQYFTVDTLSSQKPGVVIVASGTYRFSRAAGVSCGVFGA